MNKTLLLIVSLLLGLGSVQAQDHLSTTLNDQRAQQMLQNTDRQYFVENKGQWHKDVLYLCRMGGLDAWITKSGVNYTFYKIEKQETRTNIRKCLINFLTKTKTLPFLDNE